MRAWGGAPRILGPGRVACDAPPRLAARLVLGARTPSRIVWQLAQRLPDRPRELVPALAEIPWEKLLGRHAFAVRASGRSPELRHSGHAARVVKDGVVARYRARGLARPEVRPRAPELLVDAQVAPGDVRVGIDLGRGSLHRRGTGRRGRAPLREDVAAGLALLADLAGRRLVVDPFCGTGTLLAEAVALAAGVPAGRDPRALPLARLGPFAGLDLAALGAEGPEPAGLAQVRGLGADDDPDAVREARATLARLGLAGRVRVERTPVETLALPDDERGLVLTNPPWGRRLAATDVERAWAALGRLVRRRPGWTLAVVSGDPALTRRLGLRASRHHAVRIGAVGARLLIYEIDG
ncbi:MAG: hypothetical protein Kow0062_06990 [Acidobacteriota bacterium]